MPSDAAGDPDNQGYSYGTGVIAYRASTNSLFMVGHSWYDRVGEISIPPLVNSSSLSALNRAATRQGLSDIAEGRKNALGAGGATIGGSAHIGGLLVHGGSLIANSYVYYDGNSDARLSHFVSGLNLSQAGDFRGNYAVGALNPGFVAGHMTEIPQDWRALFGGPALTGQGGLAIICRTSLGPSASVFDPASLGTSNPVPATPVVGYPCDQPTLGTWSGNGTPNPDGYNMNTTIRGIVFPERSRSVLFLGRQQLGVSCYGYGTTDASLAGTKAPDGNDYCYDPVNSSKGGHGYPYASWVWAYDAADLLDVKNGVKAMWEIRPYATWKLDLPFERQGNGGIDGAAYDASTQTLYVTRSCQDPDNGYFCGPVVHAFKITP